jgi:hypothetical protein
MTVGLSIQIDVGILPTMSLPTSNELCHDIQLSRLHPDCRRTCHDMPVPECASSKVNQAATSS